MAKEIERKFLVNNRGYADCSVSNCRVRQSYLSDRREATVRIRTAGREAWLTVKGANQGAVRDEWEWAIPLSDAEEMAQRLTAGWAIDKTRYRVPFKGFTWEVDEFHGRLEGLVVAEVELPSADTEVELPPFVGREVTGDPAYYNSNLCRLDSIDDLKPIL
ncbi:MAG: CYTH domain-containing protein [Duncaniella sp.]|nr:CYTH domain-containing protein [Duncaniella sp.]